jgi:hypothetical protein
MENCKPLVLFFFDPNTEKINANTENCNIYYLYFSFRL